MWIFLYVYNEAHILHMFKSIYIWKTEAWTAKLMQEANEF